MKILKKILLFLLIWKTTLLVATYILTFLPHSSDFYPNVFFREGLHYLVWVWSNFDGSHYMSIAHAGYNRFQEPFFPLYPLSIAAVHTLTHLPFVVSGILVSHIAFVCALFVCYKLLILDSKKSLINLFLFSILLFPTSFYYGSVYNDSLFFLFATLTLYYARKRNFFLASIIASLATLTRLNGLALGFPILLEFFQTTNISQTWNIKLLIRSVKQKLRLSIFSSRITTLAFIPLAFLGYLFYIHTKLGDWTQVFSTMKIWNQDSITFPLQVFWRYFKIIVLYPSFQLNYWVAVIELIFVFLYIFLLVYSYKKIRFSYWFFFLVSILIPSLTGTFAGMPRYILHIYPAFLTLTLLLENKTLSFKLIYYLLSIIFSLIILAFFTRGYFIS